jgi:hypothetical protein
MQTIVFVVEGKPPNFLLVEVVKCAYEFWHKVHVFREAKYQLTGAVGLCALHRGPEPVTT